MPSVVGADGIANGGGYISYNGWTFYAPMFRSSLDLVPQPSADERTTIFNRFRLSVRAFVSDAGDSLSSHANTQSNRTGLTSDQFVTRQNLQKIQTLLSKNGGHLIIRGMGMDIELNSGDPSKAYDVRFGPWTRQLRFENVGNGVIWQVYWICEFSIPQCVVESSAGGSSSFSAGTNNVDDVSFVGWPLLGQGILDGLAFNTAYTIDRHGLTTRVISGELSIALNRASATGGDWDMVLATADESRELIAPDVPEGFTRISSTWETSPDRTRLRFVITDQELATQIFFPPGVVDMSLEQTSHASNPMLPVMSMIVCNFNGFIETAKGFSLSDAFQRTLLIMQERIDAARAAFQVNNPNPNATNNIFITEVTITETIIGQPRVSFSVTYTILTSSGGALFGDVVGKSGLFLDSNQTSWDEWADSMANQETVWHQRGLAGLTFIPEDDRIVGVCESIGGTATGQPRLPLLVNQSGGSLTTDCPDTDMNYLLWYPKFETNTNNPRVLSIPMGLTPSTYTPTLDAVYSDDGSVVSPNYRPGDAGYGAKGSYLTGSSHVYLTVKISALRLGMECETPSLSLDKLPTEFQNGRVFVGDTKISRGRLGKLGQCVIYSMIAILSYEITVDPNSNDIEEVIGSIKDELSRTPDDPDGKKSGGTDNG